MRPQLCRNFVDRLSGRTRLDLLKTATVPWNHVSPTLAPAVRSARPVPPVSCCVRPCRALFLVHHSKLLRGGEVLVLRLPFSVS